MSTGRERRAIKGMMTPLSPHSSRRNMDTLGAGATWEYGWRRISKEGWRGGPPTENPEREKTPEPEAWVAAATEGGSALCEFLEGCKISDRDTIEKDPNRDVVHS